MKSIAIDFTNNMVCFMTAGQQGTEINYDLKKIALYQRLSYRCQSLIRDTMNLSQLWDMKKYT